MRLLLLLLLCAAVLGDTIRYDETGWWGYTRVHAGAYVFWRLRLSTAPHAPTLVSLLLASPVLDGARQMPAAQALDITNTSGYSVHVQHIRLHVSNPLWSIRAI